MTKDNWGNQHAVEFAFLGLQRTINEDFFAQWPIRESPLADNQTDHVPTNADKIAQQTIVR